MYWRALTFELAHRLRLLRCSVIGPIKMAARLHRPTGGCLLFLLEDLRKWERKGGVRRTPHAETEEKESRFAVDLAPPSGGKRNCTFKNKARTLRRPGFVLPPPGGGPQRTCSPQIWMFLQLFLRLNAPAGAASLTPLPCVLHFFSK